MKKLLLLLAIVLSTLAADAQFPGTDSLRAYNIVWITNNAGRAFTNYRLHTLLAGMIDWIDSARAGEGGTIGVDSIAALNDSTIRYRKNGVFRTFNLKGVYDSRRKVDTLYKLNDSTIGFNINGTLRYFTFPGRINFVDSIYRKFGQDSIFYRRNGIEYALKDSTGGLSNTNTGTGFRWLLTLSQEIKTVYNSNTVTWDSTSNASGLTAKVDTSVIETRYRTDTAKNNIRTEIAAIPAGSAGQDFSPYRRDPSIRYLTGMTTTYTGRVAYLPVKVSPSDADKAIIFGTNDTLIIPTYDGDPRIAHPSIVYIEGGWNGYKYWMAFTPYPAEGRENPSIVASNDGNIWVVPAGVTNPIEPAPAGSPTNYNSDVDLVFRADENRLYLFWRYETGAGVSQHYYNYTSNPTTWSNKTLLISSSADASPAIVYKDSAWHFWEVDYITNFTSQDPFYLTYRTAPTLAGLSTAFQYRCTINNTPAGKHIWHIEIRWDDIKDQMIGIFNYTTINPGGAPNGNGVLRIGTSTDYITWDVRSADLPLDGPLYRSTFVRTPGATRQGAVARVVYNPTWSFHGDSTVMLWMQPDTVIPTFNNYDTVSNLQGIYELKYRKSNFWGYPVAMVSRHSDDSTMHVFPGANNAGLVLADSTNLSTWAGSDTIFLERLYNQNTTAGDYIKFSGFGKPIMRNNIWNGTTAWGWIDDGTNDYGESFKVQGLRGIIAAASLDTGKLFSRKNGVMYFGLNGTNLTLLSSANISTPNIPSPQIRTGIYDGASSKIRVNGVEMVSGSTTNPSSTGLYQVGVYHNGTTYADYHKGRYAGFVTFSSSAPYSGAITNIENLMLTDYAYDQDSVLYDSYTDANGTAITSHTADLRPGSNAYTASDANFQINASNQLSRSAAGTGTPTVTIDAGISNAIVEGTLTPGVAGGSGLVFRFVDVNNYYYVRVFSGTTLGVFKYVDGSFSTVQTATVSAAGTWSVRVELWGNRIRVYLNGATTPNITVTDSSHPTATRYGWTFIPADHPAIADNLKVYPFIN